MLPSTRSVPWFHTGRAGVGVGYGESECMGARFDKNFLMSIKHQKSQ